MQVLRNLSIKRKLTLINMLVSGVALLLACTAFITYDLFSARRELVHDLHTQAEVIGTNSTAALTFHDQRVGQELLATLAAKPQIVSACIYTAGGQPFARYQRGRWPADFTPPAPQVESLQFGAERLVLFRRIMLAGEPVGTIYLEADWHFLQARLQRQVWIVFIILLGAAGIAFLLSAQLQRVVSGPIVRLAQTTQLVSAEKNYAVRAVRQSHDELGVLIDGFNDMLAQIQAREEELQQRNASLWTEIGERRRVEHALRESERKLRDLFENSPDAIFVEDLDGYVLDVNPAACRLHGLPRESLLGKHVLELVPPERRSEVACNFAEQIHQGQDQVESFSWTADERAVPVEIRASRINYLDRPALLFHARDITERKRAEAELRERALWLALNAEIANALNHPAGLHETLQGCAQIVVAYLDVAFCRIWTLNAAENVLELQASAGRYTHIDGAHARVGVGQFKIGRIAQERQPYLTNDVLADPYIGDPEWARREGMVAFAGYPLLVEEHLCGVIAMFSCHPLSDATFDMLSWVADRVAECIERKRVERSLRESEARYRLIFACNPHPMWVYEVETLRFLAVNDAAVAHYGYTQEEFLAMTIKEIRPPETLPRLLEVLQQPAQELQPAGVWQHQQKDGTVIEVEISTHELDFGGRAARLVLALDVTERLQSEAAQARLQAQLRQSQKMEAIGTLAGGIAHDFNNILGAIIGYSELAQLDLAAQDPVQNYLAEVLAASNRAKELVQQILTFSRQEERERQPLQLQPILREALKLLRATLPATIEIRQQLDPQAPPILGDPTQIHQVMLNLGANAWHAMNERGGMLEVRLATCAVDAALAQAHPELQEGHYLRLMVSDTGGGMEAHIQERIFEPFFTTKPPGAGTGLGLAVVHGVVKQHAGAITVTSELGQGTTFNLYFPVYEHVLAAAAHEAEPLVRGNGARILFVDDEATLAALGKATLEHLGYQVTARTSSREALATFTAQPDHFDLVITDQTMPNLSGAELAARLLTIRPELPVILATGYSTTINPEQAQALGIRELLLKPNTAQALNAAIQRALNTQRVNHD